MRTLSSLVFTLASALSLATAAQELPGRVGRLAFIEGEVSLFQDPEEGWEQAFVNSPLTSENSVWTDPGARAEVRVAGIAVRLDDSTQLDISKLDDDELSAFIGRGSAAIRVRHFENNEILDIATSQARFRMYGTGRYRIDTDPDRDETLLTVFAGTASMRSSGGDIKVDAGRAVRVRGGSSPSYAFERAASSELDRWADSRDANWVETTSTRYVSTSMTGYEDLDAYGSWAQEADYGAVWYPTRVAADWAPYRQGHWSWVRPWGWTWIDDAPWGYAPFHYGRWVQVRNRWAWYPGQRQARPAWSPALVAFVGGGNFSVRIGAGSSPAIGWYPLAPWDRYEPWYRANPGYVTRVNIGVRDRPPRQWEGQGRGDYRTWNREQGSTMVRRDQFTSRRPVGQARINVSPEVIRQAPAVAAAASALPPRSEAPRGRAQNRGSNAPQAQQAAPQADRSNPVSRPQFGRPQVAPAPAPAPAAAPAPAPAQVNQAPARAPQQPAPQVVTPAQQPQGNPNRARPGFPQPQAPDAQAVQRQQQEAQQRQQQEAQQRQQQQEAQQKEQQDRATREANRQQQLQQLQQPRAPRSAPPVQSAPPPAQPAPPPAQPAPPPVQPAQPQREARPDRDDRDRDRDRDRDDKDDRGGGRGRQR